MQWRFESSDAARAHEARGDLLAYLATHAGDGTDLKAAELVYGELIANVVRHAPGPIAIRVFWEDATAVLQVTDSGPGFAFDGEATLPEPLSENGRGLFIAKTAALTLSVRRLGGGGSEATARLPVRLHPRYRRAG
jgi:anti-sigma regulatory factor (Ser/Thr protein kinase)